MEVNNFITASCTISQMAVYKNDVNVFEYAGATPQEFLLFIYQQLEAKYPKFYKMDNLSKLGWLATEILLKDSFDATRYMPDEVGVILSNASASLDTDIKYFETANEMASPGLFVYTLPNIVLGEICIRHQFKGENAFFICEEFDGELLHNYVKILLSSNLLQAVICGWVELLKEEYKAVLFLVEKTATEKTIHFTIENLNKIYQLKHG